MASGSLAPRVGLAGDWRLYRRLLGYIAPYWRYFVLSLAGFAVYSLGVVLLADLMQFLFDALGESGQADAGILSGLLYTMFDVPAPERLAFARVSVPLCIIGVAGLRGMGFFGGNYCISLVSRNLVHDLRCELFDKLLTLPGSAFGRHTGGSLVARITYNVEQVTGAATKALKTLLREGLVVAALIAYLLFLNWRLCLVFVAIAPLIALVVSRVSRFLRRYSRRLQTSMAEVTEVAAETVGAFRELRMYAAEARQRDRFHAASASNRRQGLALSLIESVGSPIVQFLLALALAALVWFALSPAVLADLSAGALVAFLVASVQLGKPLRQLSGVQSVLQRGLAASEDIFGQLDSPSERDTGDAAPARVRGELTARGLSFTYPGAEHPALRDVSFDIRAGETVALVGPSGSGKSTLLNLLTRFYDAGGGSLLLDGVPLERYRLTSLRDQFAIVPQDPPLLRDSVYNNIAVASPAVSPEAVHAAADAACCTEFIAALPRGMETVLAGPGGGLSGGQRQRLALARAFLRDAPVLLLDEATSAQDALLERRLQVAIERFTRERTTLVIAHRLSTVEGADRVLVLDRGDLVASGTHAQLLAGDGLYTRLYRGKFAD